jgi:HD-GYP domain-containing protein (c-di-GMP phosphodiesterase class II)
MKCLHKPRRSSIVGVAVKGQGLAVAMDLVEKQFSIDQLKMGMYVNRLDRDWLGTPFPMQGFFVSSNDDIDILRRYCNHVFVDVERRQDPRDIQSSTSSSAPSRIEALRDKVRHVDTATFSDEVPRAREANRNATDIAGRMIDDLRAGKKLSAARVQDAVTPIVSSVLRNADAFFWISSLLKRDSYLYSHAVNCSAMAAALGRHMGFPESVLMNLATGGLLLDVGKTEIPDSVLNAPEALADEAFWAMKKHVHSSLRIMTEAGIYDSDVHDMVATHHERFDGTGYPKGLSGTKIPLFGRMAAVVDSYDAMTSQRAYQTAKSRHEALQQIYRCHGTLYQQDIVEQFLQCMSIYPTGSLVELNTGEVGIVVAQNHARRLRPQVMLLLDRDKRPYERYPTIDLLSYNEKQPAQAMDIIASPEPGAYGLDPTELYLG